MVKEEQVELENYCHYSDLPSPMSYVNTIIDYDGMGNQGRFPESRKKEKSAIDIYNTWLHGWRFPRSWI